MTKSNSLAFGLNLRLTRQCFAIAACGAFRCISRSEAATCLPFARFWSQHQSCPVCLIVDGHPSHKAKKVMEFVKKTEGKLELYFLPPCSPQLNPDELVWNNLKNHHMGKRAIHTLTELKRVARSAMRSIQRTPELIRSITVSVEPCACLQVM